MAAKSAKEKVGNLKTQIQILREDPIKDLLEAAENFLEKAQAVEDVSMGHEPSFRAVHNCRTTTVSLIQNLKTECAIYYAPIEETPSAE